MRILFFTIAVVNMLCVNSCKDKDPKITKIEELSEEMTAYFVNYEVGAKWIYQDTLNTSNLDTIELISKERFNIFSGDRNKGTLTKGFELYYKPSKSKDFKVRITPGVNNNDFVKIDPMEAGVAALSFEYKNNSWLPVKYFDSIEITGNIYREVIVSPSSNSYYNQVSVSKMIGIIYYQSKVGGAINGCYKLVKTIKP
jgi:hypothetical protein